MDFKICVFLKLGWISGLTGWISGISPDEKKSFAVGRKGQLGNTDSVVTGIICDFFGGVVRTFGEKDISLSVVIENPGD